MTIYTNISDFINAVYDPNVVGNKHFIFQKTTGLYRLIDRKKPMVLVEIKENKVIDPNLFILPNRQYIIRMINSSNGLIYDSLQPSHEKKIKFFNEVIDLKNVWE